MAATVQDPVASESSQSTCGTLTSLIPCMTETTPSGPTFSDASSISSQSTYDDMCPSPAHASLSDTSDSISFSDSLSSTLSSGGVHHPHPVHNQPPPLQSFKLVGDNIDKNIRPRDMRSDHQGKSLHYFHTYAVRDRVDLSGVSDVPMSPDLSSTDLFDLLPTRADQEVLVQNFAILMAHVLRKNMPFFAKYGEKVENHIEHVCSQQMSQKSEVVSVNDGLSHNCYLWVLIIHLGTTRNSA